MAEKVLNTRLVMRNDESSTWTSVNPTLKLGEFGVETDTNKFKIGNGASAWNDLPYAGADAAVIEGIIAENRDSLYQGIRTDMTQTDNDAIAAAVGANTPVKGDICVITTMIDAVNYEQSAFMYDGTQWAAMTGNVDANNVILTEDITMAGNYDKVGNLTKSTNGTATFATKGKSVAAAFTEIFSKRLQPVITSNPSVSLTFNEGKAYEVGTEVTPSYSATLSAGSYTYGPATGITATSWEVIDTAGHTATTASGKFDKFTVGDSTSYSITAKATYEAGAVAVDNLGSTSDPVVQIAAGTKSATKGTVTGYRRSFYGSKVTPMELTSANIRALDGKATSTTNSLSVDVVEGASQVIIAVPSGRKITKVEDTGAFGTDIVGSFVLNSVEVEGANGYTAKAYNVYVYSPSAALGANTYKVTVTNG